MLVSVPDSSRTAVREESGTETTRMPTSVCSCVCAKGGGHYSLEGALFTSEKCPGGQYSPVNNVRGTLFIPRSCTHTKVVIILRKGTERNGTHAGTHAVQFRILDFVYKIFKEKTCTNARRG